VRLALVVTAVLALVFAATAAAGRVVGLGGNKNGEKINIDVGDALVVSLSSASPSGWKLAALNRAVMRPDAVSYVRALRKSTVAGYGGVQVLLFSAVRRGRTTLKLNYHRPGSPSRTFTLDVTVQPAGS
jgi:predicted secreted protein